jgi:hypothetical protein
MQFALKVPIGLNDAAYGGAPARACFAVANGSSDFRFADPTVNSSTPTRRLSVITSKCMLRKSSSQQLCASVGLIFRWSTFGTRTDYRHRRFAPTHPVETTAQGSTPGEYLGSPFKRARMPLRALEALACGESCALCRLRDFVGRLVAGDSASEMKGAPGAGVCAGGCGVHSHG